MGEHYYSQTPTSAHQRQQFTIEHGGKTLQFESDAGVFSKGHLDKGSALLLKALPEAFEGCALDLGCGWGPIGACMAVQWPKAQIVMTDINDRAVALSRENLARNGLKADVVQGDGLAHLDGLYDLIATNPPIRTGKETLYGLFAQAMEKLAPGGRLYLVIRKQQGAESAQKYLQTIAKAVTTVERGSGFRVLCAEK